MEIVGNGVRNFISDRSLFFRFVSGLTFAYVTAFACKSTITMVLAQLNARFLKPKLIRETSRIPFHKPHLYFSRYFLNTKNLFDGVVFSDDLTEELAEIGKVLVNKRKHTAPLKNVLFYGPPGTGKTLFAKKLAINCGMDFAVMTGSDFAPLGSLAVDELHKIFDWAQVSKNGSLLKRFSSVCRRGRCFFEEKK